MSDPDYLDDRVRRRVAPGSTWSVARHLVVAVVIVAGFVPLVHYNFVREVVGRDFEHWKLRDKGATARSYYHVVEQGRRFGLGTVWRMYTPARRRSDWVDWSVSTDGGETFELLDLPNLSPTYKAERSWANRFLWDFKLSKLQTTLQTRRPEARSAYARYLYRQLPEEVREGGVILRPVLSRKLAPAMEEGETWSALTSPVDLSYTLPPIRIP